MKNTDLAWSILAAPRAAFVELRERPRFWFPLLAIVLSTLAVMAWYYAIVDFDWLTDQTFSMNANAAQMTQQQRERAMAFMSPTVIMWSSLISVVVILLLWRTAEAAYYALAGKIVDVQLSFKHWFALSWWTSLPTLIGALGMVGFLVMTDSNQISNYDLQLLSLNELFFHRKMGEPGFTLLASITVLHPWMWWLAVLGVQTWSGRSWRFSAIFALLPVVLIYGIWALIAFSR
jgi:hypothetical protein